VRIRHGTSDLNMNGGAVAESQSDADACAV